MVSYKQNFINIILEHSENGSDIKEAIKEWLMDPEVVIAEESHCVCTHDIIYNYTIFNIQNGNILFPVGSCCVKHVGEEAGDPSLYQQLQLFAKIKCELCNRVFKNAKLKEEHLITPLHIGNVRRKKCENFCCETQVTTPGLCFKCKQYYKEYR